MILRIIKLLLLIIALGCFALILWPMTRQQLSDGAQHSRIAGVMDAATTVANQNIGVVLRPLRALVRPAVGYLFFQDYTAAIRAPLTAEEVENIIQTNHQDYSKRIVLIYLYDLQCALCKSNYEDINAIAESYPKDKLLVLAIAVGTTPQALSDFINHHGGLPSFKPLILQEGEEQKLAMDPSFTAAEFTKAPYLAMVDESGKISKLPFGPERGIMIRAKLDDLIK